MRHSNSQSPPRPRGGVEALLDEGSVFGVYVLEKEVVAPLGQRLLVPEYLVVPERPARGARGEVELPAAHKGGVEGEAQPLSLTLFAWGSKEDSPDSRTGSSWRGVLELYSRIILRGKHSCSESLTPKSKNPKT